VVSQKEGQIRHDQARRGRGSGNSGRSAKREDGYVRIRQVPGNSGRSANRKDRYIRIKRGEDECQVIAGGQPRWRTESSG
jgi:hypothetical protein